MSEEHDSSEPPEWFTDLPPYMQAMWVRLGLAPESWSSSGFSYAPEWAQQWQQVAWAGWAFPASLAPLYASTMYRTAMRAGWFGDVGMYGYMGRAGEAAGRAQGYMTWAAETQGPTQEYALSQASLWGARQANWQMQQQWAPVAEAWGAARLGSFMFPQFGLMRAFGFPFYSAAQRLSTATAMAPYVQAAIAQDPAALYRIQQSSTFYPSRYETFSAAVLGGVVEWTAAQSVLWSIRGGGFNREMMKGTAAIQLMQAGLSLMVDPLVTMAGRAIMGLPWYPTTQQEQVEVAAQMSLGAGLFGGGVLAGRAWGFMPSLAATQRSLIAPFTAAEVFGPMGGALPSNLFSSSEMAALRNWFGPVEATPFALPFRWNQPWTEAATIRAGTWGWGGTQGYEAEYFAQARQAIGIEGPMGFSRLAALGRVTGSIIGGQIGFEIGAGLGTAYVDALARQGRDVTWERAIIPPVAGTAGLMIGSWAMAGPLAAELPFVGPIYVGYKILQAGVQPIPGVTYPTDQQYARYPSAAGTQAYTWSGERATQGIMQFGQDVWSSVQSIRFGAPQNIGVTTQTYLNYQDSLARILQGYQANPEMWAYGMRNVPGFGTWGGQATFQDWAMRQYAFNRVGTPFWQTQGYADWQMKQYGMRNVPGFGVQGPPSEITRFGFPTWMWGTAFAEHVIKGAPQAIDYWTQMYVGWGEYGGGLGIVPKPFQEQYIPDPRLAYGTGLAPQYASGRDWYYANVVDARGIHPPGYWSTPEGRNEAAFTQYWDLYGRQAGAWALANVVDATGFGAPITTGPYGAPTDMGPYDWWNWMAKNAVDWTGLAGVVSFTNPFYPGGGTSSAKPDAWQLRENLERLEEMDPVTYTRFMADPKYTALVGRIYEADYWPATLAAKTGWASKPVYAARAKLNQRIKTLQQARKGVGSGKVQGPLGANYYVPAERLANRETPTYDTWYEWQPYSYTLSPFMQWWTAQPDYVAGPIADEQFYDLWLRWKGLPPDPEKTWARLSMAGTLQKRMMVWDISSALGNSLFEEAGRSS